MHRCAPQSPELSRALHLRPLDLGTPGAERETPKRGRATVSPGLRRGGGPTSAEGPWNGRRCARDGGGRGVPNATGRRAVEWSCCPCPTPPKSGKASGKITALGLANSRIAQLRVRIQAASPTASCMTCTCKGRGAYLPGKQAGPLRESSHGGLYIGCGRVAAAGGKDGKQLDRGSRIRGQAPAAVRGLWRTGRGRVTRTVVKLGGHRDAQTAVFRG